MISLGHWVSRNLVNQFFCVTVYNEPLNIIYAIEIIKSCACVHVCMCVCVCMHVYVCMYVCVYVCVDVRCVVFIK